MDISKVKVIRRLVSNLLWPRLRMLEISEIRAPYRDLLLSSDINSAGGTREFTDVILVQYIGNIDPAIFKVLLRA